MADITGAHCDRNQPAEVWFLAGAFGGEVERRCSVPDDRPIAAPLVNLISDSPAECEQFMKSATGTGELDGELLPVDRLDGEQVTIDAAAGNPVTGSGGRLTATACGLWVRIQPLSVGEHRLQILGESEGFSVSVEYVLDAVSLR